MRITTDTPDLNNDLLHGDITGQVIGAFYEVYNELGYGFLEAVYVRALEIEFDLRRVSYVREFSLPVYYKHIATRTYRADFLVAGLVVVEVKAARKLADADRSQLLNCLKGTKQEVGLLLHFGPKAEFHRMLSSRDLK